MSPFAWVFLAEYLILFAIRSWFGRYNWVKKAAAQYIDVTERIVMLATLLGMMFVESCA